MKLTANRKNRSVSKWLKASFFLPILPFVLFFMPSAEKSFRAEKDLQKEAEDSSKPLLSILEYSGIFLLALLEIFIIWALNNWISQPWGKEDPDFTYDQRLLNTSSAETLNSANEFLESVFHPEMNGEPIAMPAFKPEKTREHCLSLCGYSGICDQIKLIHCIEGYQIHYEDVSTYLKRHYRYPWMKPMVRYFAQLNDREGILNYEKLSQTLNESQKSFDTLKSKYEAHKVAPVLLANALEMPIKETGVPDFTKSEKIYKKELKFYR
ncbi:hypothetical protein FAI41_04810 [Acetobacteraceae bacterium]|nr:hypothetical protein FAI41_04810 [Acetobacteraceae bacterium]